MEPLQTRFLPEFLNRVDEIMIFHPLGPDQIRKIVDLQIARLRKQLEEKGIHLDVTNAALNAIATEGYDPTYGTGQPTLMAYSSTYGWYGASYDVSRSATQFEYAWLLSDYLYYY